MASTTYELTGAWSAGARYTMEGGDGPVPVLVSNLNQHGHWIAWMLTASDTPPALPPRQANPLLPGHNQPMTLAQGERVWLAMMNERHTGLARVQE